MGESGLGDPRAAPGPRPPRGAGWVGAAGRRRSRRVEPSPPLAEVGVPHLFVCRPSREAGGGGAAGVHSRLCRRGGAEGSAWGGGRSGPRAPAATAVLSSPLPPPPLLSRRLAARGAALPCLCISRPGGGGGGPLSRRGAVRGPGGALRPPPGRGSPGLGRRRAGAARGASRRCPAPSAALTPGRGVRRLCSEPGLRAVRPSLHAHFPPRSRCFGPRSFGDSRWATSGCYLGLEGGGRPWLLGSELN